MTGTPAMPHDGVFIKYISPTLVSKRIPESGLRASRQINASYKSSTREYSALDDCIASDTDGSSTTVLAENPIMLIYISYYAAMDCTSCKAQSISFSSISPKGATNIVLYGISSPIKAISHIDV